MLRRFLHSVAADVTATAGAVGITSAAGGLVLPPWLIGLVQVMVMMVGVVNAVRRQNQKIRDHMVDLDRKVTALTAQADMLERWFRSADPSFPRREDA